MSWMAMCVGRGLPRRAAHLLRAASRLACQAVAAMALVGRRACIRAHVVYTFTRLYDTVVYCVHEYGKIIPKYEIR